MEGGAMMKKMTRKVILLVLSGVLLVAGLLYLSVAWYTKMVNISGAVFDVAKWDLRAAYHLDDFEIKVYRFDTVCNDMAAPGTSGYVPIVLQTTLSDTDAAYEITIDKTPMSEEFQRRLFFYLESNDGFEVSGLPAGKYLNFEPVKEGDALAIISGKIPKHTDKTNGKIQKEVKIYWKWIYEYEDLLKEGPQGVKYVVSDIEEYFKPETTKERLELTEWHELLTVEEASLNNEAKRLKNMFLASGTYDLDTQLETAKTAIDTYYTNEANFKPTDLKDWEDLVATTDAYGVHNVLSDTEVNDLRDELKTIRTQFLNDMSLEHDIFDTEVGKYPEVYNKYMNADVHIVGDEVNPIISDNNGVTN